MRGKKGRDRFGERTGQNKSWTWILCDFLYTVNVVRIKIISSCCNNYILRTKRSIFAVYFSCIQLTAVSGYTYVIWINLSQKSLHKISSGLLSGRVFCKIPFAWQVKVDIISLVQPERVHLPPQLKCEIMPMNWVRIYIQTFNLANVAL
jgi:hypothetical protein